MFSLVAEPEEKETDTRKKTKNADSAWNKGWDYAGGS